MKVLLSVLLLTLLLCFAITRVGAWWIEKQNPAIGEIVELDGQRLHLVDQGPVDAPALILVHGASSNLKDFSSSLLPALAQRFRVLAFDRPGYGYSERGSGAWPDPAQLADLMLRVAEQRGVQQPVVLGHSWGGSVVMAALVHHPERIRGGISLAGVAGHWAGSVGWTYDLGALPLIGPLFAHTLVLPAGLAVLPGAVAEVLAPNPVPEGYVERIGARLALRPSSFLYNVQDMRMLNEYMQSLSPLYRQIERPLMVIHGDADELVPFWNHGERLEPVISDLQVRMLEGQGHAPHHSATAEVLGHIDDFMTGAP